MMKSGKLDTSLTWHKRYTICFLYLTAFGFLWLGYALFVVPIIGAGFRWSPDRIKVLESLLALLFFVLFLPSTIKRPSDFFVHIHFLLPVLPMLVLYAASNYAREYMFFVILAFAVVCIVRKINIPKIKGDIIPMPIMMWGSLLFVLIYILGIIMQGGLAYFNLDLRKVYEFRVEAAENLSGIAGYLTPLVSNILLPYILVLAVSQKKRFIACLAIVGSVMMFALTSHKSTLFYPFFTLAIYLIMRSNKRVIPLFLGSYIALILISILPFLVGQFVSHDQPKLSILLGSYGFRRGYFLPPALNFAFYDFFSVNPHTLWAESKLTFGLIDYPYNLPSTHLIGYYFRDSVDAGANTGWLGTGYMHLGFVGMLIYAFIIGLLLASVDMLAKKRDFGIIVAILFIPFLALFINSDLPTVMLTHGLLFALFLAWTCNFKKTTYTVLIFQPFKKKINMKRFAKTPAYNTKSQS